MCSFVYIGETSSGKSSIVNAIIGEKILPTGIMATTTRVCRVKYSDELKIATCDKNEVDYNDCISFNNTKQLADKLKTIARTNDRTITYVDIFMPAPFQQVRFFLIAINDKVQFCKYLFENTSFSIREGGKTKLLLVLFFLSATKGLRRDRYV